MQNVSSQAFLGASALLPFPQGMVLGRLLCREKRFFVHARLCDVESITAHTNNTGSMLGLLRKNTPVLLSPARDPHRKLRWTLEALWLGGAFADELTRLPLGRTPGTGSGFWVGVNTSTPNRMLEAAFFAQKLPWATGYTMLKREAKRGSSRLDACLSSPQLPPLWVECKNVTLVEDGVALFPDAASERARKHLGELVDIVRHGERAAMLYLVQRPDAVCIAPADLIDPAYAEAFYAALAAGVEVYAHVASVTEAGIDLQDGLLNIAPQ